MRPLAGGLHQDVLHRVVVNIVAMGIEVRLIADEVLPESLLPKTPVSILNRNRRNAFVLWSLIDTRKTCLHQPPPSREVFITLWECPDAVQVIWEDHQGIHDEGMTCRYRRKRMAQDGDGRCGCQYRESTVSHHCEEVCRTSDSGSAVVWHGSLLSIHFGGFRSALSALQCMRPT
jgi:hypothetical protein